jgi:hypothetical protein
MNFHSILFALFISLFSTFSYSQYFPFPTDDATWINVQKDLTFGPNGFPLWNISQVDRYCANGVDTIIDLQVYKKIDLCYATSSSYHGALRYDTGRVFFVPKDSINEFLLYDFTVSIGDTINVIQSADMTTPYYTTMDIPILDIDTITVNGTPRRRINGTSAPFNTWIEGIGSNAGLFMFFEQNVSNYEFGLNCASVNDTTVYDTYPLTVGTPGSCNLALSLPELEDPEVWNLFPNPVTDRTISVNLFDATALYDIKIFNAQGQELIKFTHLEKGENVVSLEGLESGAYYIHLLSEKLQSVKRLVIL